jgi:hypothetical protein
MGKTRHPDWMTNAEFATLPVSGHSGDDDTTRRDLCRGIFRDTTRGNSSVAYKL